MIVKDSLTNLFKNIDVNNPNQDIFNFVDSETLDNYFIGLYGNRRVSDLVVNADRLVVENIVVNKYMNKWNNIILNYLDSNNILDNYKEIITNIETSDNTSNKTIVNTNKVSAYNDENFVNSDEDTTIENDSNNNTGNREQVRSKIKDTNFYSKVNKYLINFDIYNIMIIDINSILTINILN